MKKNTILLISLMLIFVFVSPSQAKLKDKDKAEHQPQMQNQEQSSQNETISLNTRVLQAVVTGDFRFTINHEEIDREYLLHVPAANSGNRRPLVLVLHGGLGTAEIMMERSGFNAVSDRDGFLVAYPQGMNNLWNAGNCDGFLGGQNCGYPDQEIYDDVGFIEKVIDDIKSRFLVDNTKIFVAGFSRGGMMTHRIACELTGTITAFAVVGGTITYPNCNPTLHIPFLQINAKNDQNCPYDGGRGTCSVGDQDLSYPSVEATQNFWKEKNGITESPRQTYQNGDVHCETSFGEDARVELCTIEANAEDVRLGGHSWPGSAVPAPRCEDSYDCPCLPTQDINATEYMWRFFNWNPRYDLNCDGEVGLTDMTIFSQYYGSVVQGSNTQSSCADFNNNGEIGLSDHVLFSKHMDTSGPCNCCPTADGLSCSGE